MFCLKRGENLVESTFLVHPFVCILSSVIVQGSALINS